MCKASAFHFETKLGIPAKRRKLPRQKTVAPQLRFSDENGRVHFLPVSTSLLYNFESGEGGPAGRRTTCQPLAYFP